MQSIKNKANLRDLIAATSLVILLKLDSNHRLISPRDLAIWWMTSENNILHQDLCIISNPLVNSNWSNSLETFNWGKNWRFFGPHDLENWWMTLKNNRAPLLCCFKLCASFNSHWYIQTGVKESGNAQFGSKLVIFLSRVILKIDGWPWKTIGHLFYTMSNFVHHFKSIGEVKLELQSGNAQFASKLVYFCPAWPWNLMDDL